MSTTIPDFADALRYAQALPTTARVAISAWANLHGVQADQRLASELRGGLTEFAAAIATDSPTSGDQETLAQLQGSRINTEDKSVDRWQDCLQTWPACLTPSDLARDGVLVGAAIYARERGVHPYFLLKYVACTLLLLDRDKPSMTAPLPELKAWVAASTGLDEPDLIYATARHLRVLAGGYEFEDPGRAQVRQRAYGEGFAAERNYRGCAQCTLIGLGKVTGCFNEDVFNAASSLSGGVAQCGDGVCGGYSGGVLHLSMVRGRTYQGMLADGDKVNQYTGFALSQALHDRYRDCYGALTCTGVHSTLFEGGQSFVLRDPVQKEAFNAAGAHSRICTTVVAMASAWTAEILFDNGLIKGGPGEAQGCNPS